MYLCILCFQTDHKKTFYYLEQLILKHRAHVNTVNIKPCHGMVKAEDLELLLNNFLVFVYYQCLLT